MRTPLALLVLALLPVGCVAAQTSTNKVPQMSTNKIKLGIDNLRDSNYAALAGKRVGLIANPASVDSNLTSTIDLLAKQKRCELVALFGPEHGIWGDEYAGVYVGNRRDPKTGLPVYSIYGKTRRPTTQMFREPQGPGSPPLDVIVLDLQDIGSRSYTYISTMKNVLDACAEHDIELVILDRPNPLGGLRIEGPEMNRGYESFVGALPVPYVHGMTMGELALLTRDKFFPQFRKLTIIKMSGWRREMTWRDTGLHWVPTSPHIPQSSGPQFYAATGLIGELQVLSNGIGYTLPFEIVGAPFVDGEKLSEKLDEEFQNHGRSSGHAGVRVRPIRYRPFFGQFPNENCQGVQVYVDDHDLKANLVEINFRILRALNAPKLLFESGEDRISMFYKVCGGPEAADYLAYDRDLDELFAKWRRECEDFRRQRDKYLLY